MPPEHNQTTVKLFRLFIEQLICVFKHGTGTSRRSIKMASELPTILIIGGTGSQGNSARVVRGKLTYKGFLLPSASGPAASTIFVFRLAIQIMFGQGNLRLCRIQHSSLVVPTMKQISVVRLKVSQLHSSTPMALRSAKRLRYTGVLGFSKLRKKKRLCAISSGVIWTMH